MPLAPDQLAPHEHWEQHLSAFAACFLPRRDCYAQQTSTGYRLVKAPLTLALVRDHLMGKLTLGAYALDTQSHARWLCLDADDETHWAELLKLAGFLATEQVPSYLESSRRGGHLWLFLARTSGAVTRRFGQHLLTAYGLDPQLELYPKQDHLKTGPGSLVRLPLGVHLKSGKRYPFIGLDGMLLAPTIREQLAILSHPKQVPPTFIERILTEVPVSEPVHHPPVTLEPRLPTPSDAHHLSERLKSAISVWDFVSRYVDLDAQGRGFCPFHDDHHQSFGVNASANYWHCWAGCGGGSIIDFWMKFRAARGLDSSFVATITELAQLLFPR